MQKWITSTPHRLAARSSLFNQPRVGEKESCSLSPLLSSRDGQSNNQYPKLNFNRTNAVDESVLPTRGSMELKAPRSLGAGGDRRCSGASTESLRLDNDVHFNIIYFVRSTPYSIYFFLRVFTNFFYRNFQFSVLRSFIPRWRSVTGQTEKSQIPIKKKSKCPWK